MKTILKTWAAVLLTGSSLVYGGGDLAQPQEPAVDVPEVETMESRLYLGLGVDLAQVNSHLYGKDKVIGLTARAGYDLNKYLGIEVRGSAGAYEYGQLSHEYSYGIYLKPQLPINDQVSVYGLVGYGRSKIKFEHEPDFNGITNNYTTQDGLSYGGGIEYQYDEQWSFFADVMRLIDKSAVINGIPYAIKVDTLNAGLVYRFY